jgi:outer membrane biogenesis lipoprotein LolB
MNQSKAVKRVVSVFVLVMLACTLFAGCSKKKDVIIGKWSLTEMAGLTLKELAEQMQITEEDMETILTFSEDGKGTQLSGGKEEDLTWKNDGETYSVVLSKEMTVTATIADNILTMDIAGQEAKFEKK